jgi:hypothetical protein
MAQLAIWKSRSKGWRLIVVLVQLAILDQYCVYLANVGRNTFEHVQKPDRAPDSFREGVFWEAKASDTFAKRELPVIYAGALCLGILALWPALAKKDLERQTV